MAPAITLQHHHQGADLMMVKKKKKEEKEKDKHDKDKVMINIKSVISTAVYSHHLHRPAHPPFIQFTGI